MGRPANPVTTPADVIDDAVETDKQKIADDLEAALDAVSSFASSDLKFIIHKVTRSGKWEYVKETYPPINIDELMTEIRDEFGDGEYSFRIMALGKLRKTVHFGIAKPKIAVTTNQRNDDMMPLLISQMNQSKTDSMQMMQFMMQQQNASADRQMQMMNQSQQTMMTLMSAIIGGKEKPGEMIAAFAGMANLFKPEKSDSLKETVETLAAVKGLFGGDSGGDDNSVLGIIKAGIPMLGPVAQSVGDMIAIRKQDAITAHQIPNPQNYTQNPAPQITPQISIPAGVSQQSIKEHAVLSLIRDEINLFMAKSRDPELVADTLFEILDAEKVPQNALVSLVVEFQGYGEEWPQRLAEYGIPVTPDKFAWFNAVIANIVRAFNETQDNGADTDTSGETGGNTDA